MERFVQAVTGGGLALVAGLWVTTFAPAGTPAWAGGFTLTLLGIGGLGYGLWDVLT